MKVKKTKKGTYKKDNDEFFDWLLVCVLLGICVFALTVNLITYIF